MSWRKKTLFWSILLFLVLSTAELGARLCLASFIGRSILWYGTPFEREVVGDQPERSALLREIRQRGLRGAADRNHSARHADDLRGNYFKYKPNQQRVTYDVDTGEVYRVTINRRGFRGREFSTRKKPGVLRVLTLGSSSTFGYHNRDEGTYPARLEGILNERCELHGYEVINLGIPHLTSSEIMALFLAEGVLLAPDVVTFSEGYNDAHEVTGEHSSPGRPASSWKEVSRWARDHFLTVEFGHEFADQWTKRFSPELLGAPLEEKKQEFLENLSALQRTCEEIGAVFIVASQQARSLSVLREDVRGITYADEVRMVRERLSRSGYLTGKEVAFLGHDELMQAEQTWARESGVRFADVKGALDQRRDEIISWVHLSHAGNLVVAEQLARVILEQTCTPQPSLPEADVALTHGADQ